MWWEPPPVQVDRQDAESGATENLLCDLLSDGVLVPGVWVIERGSRHHTHLAGALDGLMRVMSDHHDASLRDDLERLLGMIEKYGGVHVHVER